MITIIFTLLIFLELIMYIVIIDIVLSWVSLLGFKWRPQFIASVIDPLYTKIKSIIPTSLGPVDFTPIIIFIGITFIKGLLFMMFPEAQVQFHSLMQ